MTPLGVFAWVTCIACSVALLGFVLGVGIMWFAFCGAEARRIWGTK